MDIYSMTECLIVGVVAGRFLYGKSLLTARENLDDMLRGRYYETVVSNNGRVNFWKSLIFSRYRNGRAIKYLTNKCNRLEEEKADKLEDIKKAANGDTSIIEYFYKDGNFPD